MEANEIATKLVAWCNEGDFEKPYQELYSEKIVSIENDGSAEGAYVEGFEGIKKKGEWWQENFEVHSSKASEPLSPTIGFRSGLPWIRPTNRRVSVPRLPRWPFIR